MAEQERRRIRTDDGALTVLGEKLGAARLEEFVAGHGQLQAMAFFLVMAVSTAAQAEYSDEALDALIVDANDVLAAAERWARDCIRLAEAWRAQRETSSAGDPSS